MGFICGFIVLIIGACLLIAGFIITDDMNIVFIALGLVGIILGMIMISIAVLYKDTNKNESLIKASTEIVSLTESQTESVANSIIKVALIQNYPEAEIISNVDWQQGIFIYNNETYNFEVEDNVLFIKQDKKLVKYIYLN